MDASADGGSTGMDANGDSTETDGDGDSTGLERLNPRVRWLWVLRALVPAAILGIAVAAVGLFLDLGPAVGGAVGVLAFLLGAVHAIFRFRAFGYRLQEDALYIERGVLTKVNTIVPYVRVQHVDTRRSPIERTVGLGRVVVYTAGSRGADVSIPGLLPDRASGLQNRLRELAEETDPDDAV